ncbi:hypothetical protein GCM10022402_41990 [Salinactinospora qingdaonensis]|uniref:Uncharacterized protein n=1 Tax=Salinactinospora qingdaonensis TaxID=702744 RepID=A0ABP7G989_9ACTN
MRALLLMVGFVAASWLLAAAPASAEALGAVDDVVEAVTATPSPQAAESTGAEESASSTASTQDARERESTTGAAADTLTSTVSEVTDHAGTEIDSEVTEVAEAVGSGAPVSGSAATPATIERVADVAQAPGDMVDAVTELTTPQEHSAPASQPAATGGADNSATSSAGREESRAAAKSTSSAPPRAVASQTNAELADSSAVAPQSSPGVSERAAASADDTSSPDTLGTPGAAASLVGVGGSGSSSTAGSGGMVAGYLSTVPGASRSHARMRAAFPAVDAAPRGPVDEPSFAPD